MLQTVLNDFATLKFSYKRSLSAQNIITDLILTDSSLTNYTCESSLFRLDISTAANLFLNYSPKVYLERYMRYKKGRSRESYENHSLKDVIRLGGFKRQDLSRDDNIYNRNNVFDIASNKNEFDITPQKYFIFEFQENNYVGVSVIGGRSRVRNFELDNILISRLFRFVLEFEVEETLIKKNLAPFYIRVYKNKNDVNSVKFSIKNT